MESNGERKQYWLAALFISCSIVLAAAIGTYGLIQIKSNVNTVTVTGSAKKQIKSDLIVWKAQFSNQSEMLADAYQALTEDLKKVKNYFIEKGVDEKDIIVLPVSTIQNSLILPNGTWTNQIESYRLIQEIEIRSVNVDELTKISRESTELINEGIQFESFSPQYFYTKIADLKIDMLALATKDARERAEKMAINAGASIQSLRSARMGVFQITPLYSNEVSDYGINDTSSIEKEIMAVANCVFISK